MKELISIRIKKELLEKIDNDCKNHNDKSKYIFFDGTSYYRNGFKSRADVIEKALKEYYNKSNT